MLADDYLWYLHSSALFSLLMLSPRRHRSSLLSSTAILVTGSPTHAPAISRRFYLVRFRYSNMNFVRRSFSTLCVEEMNVMHREKGRRSRLDLSMTRVPLA